MFPSILIVDDEPSILQSLGGLLTDEGFEVLTATNGYEALKRIETESPDLVLLDIWMPGIDGIETLKQIKSSSPQLQVIIFTGHGTIETAVRAIKMGAYDLIEKPLSIDKVIVTINNALNFRRLEEENRYLRRKTIEKHSITGSSMAVMELKKQIAVAAPTDSWILVCGENGTGKELVARTIHQLSTRADQPLIEVSCAAIPDDLIESELFGHEKGALAGITSKKRGKFELASNGTLFFDEITDMSLRTQGKLLRVLQEQEFQRVGGGRTISVDVRIIAATNKDLEEEIRQGAFREDLYYRLNVIPIQVPPLRKRREDISALVDTFLSECALQSRSRPKRISQEVLKRLCTYDWPGNVRELKNLVERLTIMVASEIITEIDLPPLLLRSALSASRSVNDEALFMMGSLEEARQAFEMAFIRRKLVEQDNDVGRVATDIGVSDSYLQRRLKAES